MQYGMVCYCQCQILCLVCVGCLGEFDFCDVVIVVEFDCVIDMEIVVFVGDDYIIIVVIVYFVGFVCQVCSYGVGNG